MIGSPPTRDLKRLEVPPSCLTASALRSLANVLDRLSAFHAELGGKAPDAPCLTAVATGDSCIRAAILSGQHIYEFDYRNGAWELVYP